MKIIIELDEDIIKSRLTSYLTSCTNKSPSWLMRDIIEKVAREAIEKKIKEEYKIKISQEIKDLLQAETERYAHKKIPGWIAQRVKELLESVRKQYEQEN